MHDPTPILVCADDFAQDRTTSDAILELVANKRLSAISCFSDGPLWRVAGAELAAAGGGSLIGLHFNLSYPFGFGEKPLHRWIVQSLSGRIDRSFVQAALRRQVEKFTLVLGRLPDFIDGHQHVHAFPLIRNIVRAEIERLAPRSNIRVRNVSTLIGRTDAPIKRATIRFLARIGSAAPQPEALNSTLGGDYSLSPSARYSELFTSWLAASSRRTLIMCHPRLSTQGGRVTAGQREFDFLASKHFLELLVQNRCCLTPGQSGQQPAVPAA